MVLFLDFPVDPRVAMPCPSSSVAKCPRCRWTMPGARGSRNRSPRVCRNASRCYSYHHPWIPWILWRYGRTWSKSPCFMGKCGSFIGWDTQTWIVRTEIRERWFSTGHPSPTARPLAFAWFMERVAWAKLWPLVPLSITKNPCHLADP